MSEKFDMKVVIDSVTTPLLHERLRAARSYRERAAILRSLAESALRGTPAGLTRVAGTDQPAAAGPPTRATTDKTDTVVPLLERGPESEVLAGTTGDGHDVSALAAEFASFLDAHA
jgi:hypothetical protein